jgi:hypothetical protein
MDLIWPTPAQDPRADDSATTMALARQSPPAALRSVTAAAWLTRKPSMYGMYGKLLAW